MIGVKLLTAKEIPPRVEVLMTGIRGDDLM